MGAIGSLYVELVATVDPFIANMKRAQKESEETVKYLKPIKETAKEVGEAMSIVGDVIAGTFIEATLKTAEYGAELDHLHIKSGASVEDLAKLGFAAEQNGSSLDGLGTGLKFLSKNMELASERSKGQVQAFAALGITTKDLNEVHGKAAEMFALLADRIKGMEDPSQHAADLTKILGKNWTELLPTLSLGSEGLKAAGDEAERLGKVMSEQTAAESLKLTQELDKMKNAAEGVGISVGTAFIPMLTNLSADLTDVIVDIRQFTQANPEMVQTIGEAAAVIGGAGGLLLALTGIMTVLPKVQMAVEGLGGAMTVLGGVAIVALIFELGELYLANKKAEEAQTNLKNALADSVKSHDRAVTSLKEYGVAVDTTGMSEDGRTRAIARAGQELQAMLVVTDSAKEATKLQRAEIEAAEKAAAKFKAAVDSLVDSTDAESKKDLQLIEYLKIETAQHGAVAAVTAAHGKQVVEMVDQMKLAGATIDANTLKWYDAIKATEKSNEAVKEAANQEHIRRIEMDLAAQSEKNHNELITAAVKHTWDLDDATKALIPSMVAAAGAQSELDTAIKKALDSLRDPNAHQQFVTSLSDDRVEWLRFRNVLGEPMPPMDTGAIDASIAASTKKTEAALKASTEEVKQSAGKIFDDMFIKGQGVFSDLNAAIKGGALSLGRSIFEDVIGALLGPVKQAFSDFFSQTLKGFVGGFAKDLGAQVSGALNGGSGVGGGFLSGLLGLVPGLGLVAGGIMAGAAIGNAIGGSGNSNQNTSTFVGSTSAYQYQQMQGAPYVYQPTNMPVTVASYNLPHYADGGPTGPGGPSVLHPNEYVVPQNGALVMRGGASSDPAVLTVLQRILEHLQAGTDVFMDGQLVSRIVTKNQYNLTRNRTMVSVGAR